MKRPDHSIEIEQGALGACLVWGEGWRIASDLIKPEHFFEPLHQQIFDIGVTLHRMGKVANAITIGTFLPDIEVVRGMKVQQYVAKLAAEATPLTNLPDYAGTIRDFYDRRQITLLGQQMMDGYNPNDEKGDAAALATYAIDALDGIIADRVDFSARPVTMQHSMAAAIDAAAKAYENDGAITGLSWGLTELNQKTLGLHAADLIVMAGRPSMGKSAVLASWARKVAKPESVMVNDVLKVKPGAPGVIFSLEMRDVDLSMRMLSDEINDMGIQVPFWQIKSGRFREQHFNTMIEASRRLAELPIKIEQQSNLTLAQIASRARQAKRRDGIQWMAVDHLGLVRPSERYRGNKASEIGEVTTGLKALAKELGIPILLLAQISRGVEGREDKRPQLSDLRDSGRIEEDADVVIMLYRKAYYLMRSEPPSGTAEHIKWEKELSEWHNKLDLGIEKNRNGPTGPVRVMVDIACNAVRDLVAEPDYQEGFIE